MNTLQMEGIIRYDRYKWDDQVSQGEREEVAIYVSRDLPTLRHWNAQCPRSRQRKHVGPSSFDSNSAQM